MRTKRKYDLYKRLRGSKPGTRWERMTYMNASRAGVAQAGQSLLIAAALGAGDYEIEVRVNK